MAESPTSPDQEPKLSWVHPIATRDGTLTADSKMVNCFVELTESGAAAVKRAATLLVQANSGTAQGQFTCNGQNYAIVNDVIINVATGGTIAIPGVSAAGQHYDVLSDVPFAVSLLKSTTGLWIFDFTALSATKVTDPNYPALTVPGIAYLDGIYYVMDQAGEVVGSATEDATTWPPLDFIEADLTLGLGAGIVRHLNYIVAFYLHGVQMYYDADAAPNGQGTALGPVTNASWTTGCINGFTIVEQSDITFFMAQDKAYGRTIQQIQGLSMGQISTPAVERVLNRTQLSQPFSYGIRLSGHLFFVLTLQDINVTLVYDQTSQQWQQWSSVVNGVEQFFVGRYYLATATQNLVQDVTTGNTVALEETTYTDASGPVNVTIVTPSMDWGTMSWKRFKALFLFADSAPTTVDISYSDDDYATFSTPRGVLMSSVRKMLQRCGRSRRRAWKLTHADNTPLKIYGSKLDVSVGPS